MSETLAHDLHTFMDQIAAEMSSEYSRIYNKSVQDPGTAGDEGEENWANLFRDWLPPTYHIATKGRLISHDGRLSNQVDLLVLKPSYPRKLREKKVWLASGVAAAFECKNTLTAAHVVSSASRCIEFKSLYENRIGTPRREIKSPLIYGILAHSHSWKGSNSKPIKNVEQALSSSSQQARHPRQLLDLICVADLALWKTCHITSYNATWNPDAAQYLRSVFGAPFGPMVGHTCASFESQHQNRPFQPIGALLAELSEELAWNDPSARDLADYYRKTGLLGSGGGSTHPWPTSIFSDEVRKRIEDGYFTNGIPWDEWSVSG